MAWQADGLYKTEEEIDNSAWYNTRPNIGDIKYVDLNGDGKIDSYDIHKVVTWSMLPHVEIVGIEVANMDGLGYVRIREEVA